MICACGKEAMDGVRCKFGASHMTLEAVRKMERRTKPRELLTPLKSKLVRERLDVGKPKRQREFLF